MTEDDFLGLFARIWIEIHFLLESPIINFSQVIIIISSFADVFMPCVTENKDMSSANSLELEERPFARYLMQIKNNEGPIMDP